MQTRRTDFVVLIVCNRTGGKEHHQRKQANMWGHDVRTSLDRMMNDATILVLKSGIVSAFLENMILLYRNSQNRYNETLIPARLILDNYAVIETS